jgi:hypothetical protein
MTLKTCNKCGEEKNINLFKKNHAICRTCYNIWQKTKYRIKVNTEEGRQKIRNSHLAWRRKNRLHVRKLSRNSHLKITFGITPEQYDEMCVKQNFKCAVCREKDDMGKRLSIDHDHSTGRIRGLLCTKCNLALGNLKDNTESIKRLLVYLTSSEALFF